jgi:hypothetical protein
VFLLGAEHFFGTFLYFLGTALVYRERRARRRAHEVKGAREKRGANLPKVSPPFAGRPIQRTSQARACHSLFFYSHFCDLLSRLIDPHS